jgi:hypothetical protein
MSITGGDTWVEESIADGTLVAVMDGSYIRELFPNVCLAAFVLECSNGQGQIFGAITEASRVANAYIGELLGLMAIHLIILSINKMNPELSRSVEIVSDCLGALKRVAYLPPYMIPSQCQHSNILKTIEVHCCRLTFTTYYLHIKAHQDNNVSFSKLSRKAQLNCICNHAAKQRIATDVKDGAKYRGMFPLELVGLFIGDNKMTSDTGEQIHFGAHRQLAKDFFHDRKKLLHSQFESIEWLSVHQMLRDLSRLFQIWAEKHILEIAGATKFLAHQDGRSPLCPSCQDCGETCTHIALCSKIRRVAAFTQSTQGVEQWLGDQNTHPNLQSLLLRYL